MRARARGGDGGARRRARPARRGGPEERPAAGSTLARSPCARARALRHLLLALPRPRRHGRRHGRPARLHGTTVLPRRPPAAGARRTPGRRHDARVGDHAALRRAGAARRPLGDRRLHPRAPAEPARTARRRAAGGAGPPRGGAAAVMTDSALLRLERRALAVGAVALVVAGVGGAFSPAAFFRAWLVSWLFWLSIPLGALAIVMLHYLSGGSWGIVIRRVSESTAATLPLLALLFVPIAVGVRAIYEWARPAEPAFQYQHGYLNVPFFLARAALYFVAWIAVAQILVRWSAERDRVPDPDPRRFRLFAGPGLVVYGLTVTFASIDWGMSIEPHWSSTVYPMMFAVGQVLAGFAFTITIAVLL